MIDFSRPGFLIWYIITATQL